MEPPPSYDKSNEVNNGKGNGPIQVVTEQINVQKCSKCSNAAVDTCSSCQILICLDHRQKMGKYGNYCEECGYRTFKIYLSDFIGKSLKYKYIIKSNVSKFFYFKNEISFW